MRKIRQSSKNITPFGGLNFIYNAIKQSKSDIFIDQELGCRNFRTHYSYSDIVLSLLGNSLCNGEMNAVLGNYNKILSFVLINCSQTL